VLAAATSHRRRSSCPKLECVDAAGRLAGRTVGVGGEYYGIVISGTLTNPFAGEASPPQLEAGSAWSVPGDSDHVTACVSTEPCLFYFHAREAFDFTPVCE